MRHKVVKHSFGRKPSQRKALIRSLVDSIVEHGRIRTTLPKAKELRRHVERAVTKGKSGTVHARRVLLSSYPNKGTVKTLVDDLGKRFKDRPGGYTRIIRAGRRPGDNAPMAYIEFIDYELPTESTVVFDEKAHAKKVATKRKTLRTIQKNSRKRNRK